MRSPAVAAGMALLYALIGLRLCFDPTTLHDEGLLTYGGARALGEDFLPMLFFQKTRPFLSLFYALVARAGVQVFLVAHVAVAAAAIPLVAATARALGVRNANVAAAVVAFSPLFLWSGPTGLANSDGVAGFALALYLMTRRRTFAAGALLGGLPWIRYELALFVALLAAHEILRERSRTFLLGLALWPASYFVGGALYHRDLLWIVHFPPGLPEPMAGNRTWMSLLTGHDLSTLLRALFSVTPLVVLLPFVRLRALSSLERVLLGGAALYLGLFALTHLVLVRAAQAWVFGVSPRYALQALPVVGILAARVVDGFEPEEIPRRADVLLLAALAALAVIAQRLGAGSVPLGVVAGAGAALTLARLGAPLAPVPLAIVVAAAPFFLMSAMEREGYRRYVHLAPLVRAVEARSSSGPPPQIFTNIALFAPYVARTGALPGRTVHFILQADHLFEMRELSNPANGQRERVRSALPRSVFGDAVDAATFTPAALPPGTLFVLREDERNELTLPAAVWAPSLHEISRHGRFFVSVLHEAP